MKQALLTLLGLAAAAVLVLAVRSRLQELEPPSVAQAERPPVPVELGRVEQGLITLRRTFSGALEAAAEFVAAPKVAGRLQRLEVDIGDPVRRGQVVAWLDDAEFVQARNQAEAELAVARASHTEARSALEIAERALARARTLRGEGVTSESQMDAARAEELSARARVAVTEAGIARAEAALEAARIRERDTQVTADWTGGDDERVVSERSIDEGATVSASTPLMTIVELDPIVAVLFVPERDYAHLAAGQAVSLVTDSFPGREFQGEVARIAPVFRRATRQARVEVTVENGDEALKPGMFVRATIVLERIARATIVPFDALSERGGETGLFVLDGGSGTVRWTPVRPGVREGDRIQVLGEGVTGQVVTLGQELCDDGSRVRVPDEQGSGAEPPPTDETLETARVER